MGIDFKDDIGYFEDVEPLMDMKHFVLLLLADLASKSPYIFYNGQKDKIACLPAYYKEIISQIMYEENGWGIKFSKLIDIKYYYENQSEWENDLGNMIQSVLNSMKKNYIFNFETDRIEISFMTDEIKSIKEQYDEETLRIMDHFSNLIGSTIFNRSDKLNRHDLNRRINRSMEYNYQSLILKLRQNGIKNPEKYLNKRKD